MKNRFLPFLALLCAVAALLLSAAALYAVKTLPDPADELSALKKENEALLTRLEALEQQAAQIPAAPVKIGLQEWELVPTALSEVNAASVSLRAVPVEYAEGLQASLVVHLNGQAAADVSCIWDDGVFTAVAELPAANGYAYYCLMTDPDGNQQQIPLVTPEKPDELLINLADSLAVYCHLVMEDFRYEEDTLTALGCYAQLQLPLLSSAAQAPEYSRAQLVLCRNGEALSSQTVVLTPGEGSGCFETTVDSMEFAVPALEEGDLLELQLEAVLSDGTTVAASGAGWFRENGELILAVG